ncbi:hypothetical protein AgCh_014003 [Apium graveolens]
MGLLSISRWAFEQGLVCSPNNWNCMEKLMEVLIAIGDEIACLSVAELILRHWPSHSRALHVKNTIVESEPIPFAPRGIDKLEPKHVRLKFQNKRKPTNDEIVEGVSAKKLNQNLDVHLAEATWTALVDALLDILLPSNVTGNVISFEERRGPAVTPNAMNVLTGYCNSERGNVFRVKEPNAFEEQPHERRSSRLERLRSCKSDLQPIQEVSAKGILYQDAFIKFLELEKLTRHWGQDRTPECSLFLSELYFDFGSRSSDSSVQLDSMSDANYLLCKVIESIILEHPISMGSSGNKTSEDNSERSFDFSYLLNDNSSFWVRYYWLCGQLSVLNGDKAKALKEFSICFSLLADQKIVNNPVASVFVPHSKVIEMFLVKLVKRRSSGVAISEESEQWQKGCFVDAAIAFFKLQHLIPSVPVKSQIELIVAIPEMLAEYGLCCAGGDGEEDEGKFLKLAIKHLFALDMKLKSNSNSSNKGMEVTQLMSSFHYQSLRKLDSSFVLDPTGINETSNFEKETVRWMTSNVIQSQKDLEKEKIGLEYGKGSSDGFDVVVHKSDNVSNHYTECSDELTEDEREELELKIENALDQCFFCLYGLQLRSDSLCEEDLVIHKNTSRGHHQTKEQCADVFQYILPYAKASSVEKALRKNDNVVNSEVVDISGNCLCNDNVNYVNLVDDCDENVYVSEHRFENEDLHENSEFVHEGRDKSVVGEEVIIIPFLSQNFPNLVAAENIIRAYALKNGFAIKIQNTQRRVDKIIYARTYVCNLAGENRDKEPVEDEEVLIGSVGSEKKKRRRDKLPRSGCKFRIYVINRRNTRHWEITSLELNHNHDIVSPSKMNLIKRE